MAVESLEVGLKMRKQHSKGSMAESNWDHEPSYNLLSCRKSVIKTQMKSKHWKNITEFLSAILEATVHDD